MGLMLASETDKQATLADLRAVPVPPSTRTYSPINHGDFVDLFTSHIEGNLPLVRTGAAFGLARNGRRMFGVLHYEAPPAWSRGLSAEAAEGMKLSVGLRSSLDKSIAGAGCLGAVVTVCSNLCFGGDLFTEGRRHSGGFSENFRAVLDGLVSAAKDSFRRTLSDMDSLRAVPVSDDAFFALLGVALGREIVTSTESLRALEYWLRPPHAEHEGRDLFCAYQAINHGLKRAQPERAIEAHQSLHGYAVELREIGGVWRLGDTAKRAADSVAAVAAD